MLSYFQNEDESESETEMQLSSLRKQWIRTNSEENIHSQGRFSAVRSAMPSTEKSKICSDGREEGNGIDDRRRGVRNIPDDPKNRVVRALGVFFDDMHGSCVEGGIGGRTGKDKGRGRGRGEERQSNVDRELERESMSEPGVVGEYDGERGGNLSKVSKIVAEQNHIIPSSERIKMPAPRFGRYRFTIRQKSYTHLRVFLTNVIRIVG